MAFGMKFFYLFTFIFAINFLSVKCVYKKDCTKACTAEKEWLKDLTKTLSGPKLPVEFDSTFAETVTPPFPRIFFGVTLNGPLKLKIEGDYLVAYTYFGTSRNYIHAGILDGFIPNDKIYIFHSAYFNIASLYSQSAGTSSGNGENPHTGPPILVTLYFFKAIKQGNLSGLTGPTSETDPDAWIKVYATIGVNGVIDNPLVDPLITDIQNIGPNGRNTNMEKVFGAFFEAISKRVNSVFYTPDQDTRPGKTHTNNAIGLYFDTTPLATISYAQWQEFTKLKNNDGEPLSHVEEFFPMYDCLPIGQVKGVEIYTDYEVV